VRQVVRQAILERQGRYTALSRYFVLERLLDELKHVSGLPQLRRWSGEKIIQGQEEVREFYFESGRIDILKKSRGDLKEF